MKRAEITDAKESLMVTETLIPSPPAEGARLKTVFAGICHSDIHVIDDSGEYLPGMSMTRREIYKKLGMKYYDYKC